MHAVVHPFLHAQTSTWSYVVADADAHVAAIIDPVLDFDAASGRAWTESADKLLACVRESEYEMPWILETHAHADHLSAARHLKDKLGAQVAIGAGIVDVQKSFRDILNLGSDFAVDGRQFDWLLRDGDEIALGGLTIRVIATPGHTSDSLSYVIGDAVFVGDSIFMPDGGTARCDFPGGNAARLYSSIRRLYELPPETRVFVCHDYGPGGRERRCETTISAERAGNIHLRDGVSETEFVALRTTRDATLALPALLYPSVQVNIRAGSAPTAESNGRRYLKFPLSGLDA
jgi:glyoxylase-like metal-dependent hydrolase (beta-lactamase superfamily II)